MEMMLVVVGALLIFSFVIGEEVCYSQIGCFNNTVPYDNAQGMLPKSPDQIKTGFTLQTRQKGILEQLDPYNKSTVSSSHFNTRHKTSFIVHGFHSTNKSEWIQPLVDALLEEVDLNVIVVDWSGGAYDTYPQSVANTRVVGAVIAELVKTLHNTTGIDYANVHLVGHSLGSHICGYAGERIPGLGRITGLDPAGPMFQYLDAAVRIDPTDALFVDVIHTDGSRYGLRQAVGDVDFYPNGGAHQPGCLSDHADPSLACNHVRAIFYFSESINLSCHFKSYPCNSKSDFDENQCSSCGIGCQTMGYHAHHDITGTFYLNTSWHYPFCSKTQH